MDIQKVNENASANSGVRPNFLYGNLLDQMRYIETLNYINGLDVLDIASGVGWGSYLMSTIAKSVKGIDLSEEAINTSQKYYSNSNIEYILGNSKEIPCNENTFDVIVTFETFEHVDNVNSFVDDLYRVGKTNALLILSTPNGFCTKMNKECKPSNPYHLEEYYKSDLFNVLVEKWEIIEYKGQYPIKRNSDKIIEYRKWTRDYWELNKKNSNSFVLRIINRIVREFFPNKYILNEPAYNQSCRPVSINDGYEPVVHFVVCRSKKK